MPGVHELPLFNTWPLKVKLAFRSYIDGIDYKSDSLNKFSLIYSNMTNFLKLHGIDYYYFNALHNIKEPSTNLLHQLNNNLPNYKIFNQIKEDSNYLEPFNKNLTYYNYLKVKYNCHVDGRHHHFLEDAQTEWANILASRIGHKF